MTNNELLGLITYRDISNKRNKPNSNKDTFGRFARGSCRWRYS